MAARRPRLRLVVVGVALVLLFLVQLFGVVVSGVSARRSAVAVARDAIRREGNTTIQSILRHLEPAEQSAKVTSRLLADALLDTTHPGLERYLFTQLAVMPQMTGAFVGFADGGFVFVSREDQGYRTKRISMSGGRTVEVRHLDSGFVERSTEQIPDDTFDPRTRPWYTQAAGSESLQWTDPYVFFSSRKPGVTAAHAVRREGKVVAVVGVDVELSGLSTFIDHLSVSEHGEAFVVSDESIVAAPTRYASQPQLQDDGSLRLPTTAELGVTALTDRPAATPSQNVHPVGDSLVLHSAFPQSQGVQWAVVVRAPEADFTGAVREQQRSVLLIWLAGSALIGAAALIMLRVTRPLSTLQNMAATDPLTGVANRRSLTDVGAKILEQSARADAEVAVMMIDLDGFKTLNDHHGHEAGDRALQLVGRTLQAAVGENDLVGRLGGDEFVVVRQVTSRDEAGARAERIVDQLTAALRSMAPDIASIGASAGIVIRPAADTTFDVLLHEADLALLAQKTTGKGSVRHTRPAPANQR